MRGTNFKKGGEVPQKIGIENSRAKTLEKYSLRIKRGFVGKKGGLKGIYVKAPKNKKGRIFAVFGSFAPVFPEKIKFLKSLWICHGPTVKNFTQKRLIKDLPGVKRGFLKKKGGLKGILNFSAKN